MTTETIKHIVLLPVGPETLHEHVHDTIESIRHYTDPDRRIILIDDRGPDDRLKEEGDDLDVLINAGESGKSAKLHITLNQGVIHALENYQFSVLLRLDDDALIIGSRPEDDAIRRFQEHPNTGQLGSFKLSCMGYKRDLSWVAMQLKAEMSASEGEQDGQGSYGNELAKELKRIYSGARENGYELGEHCLGAATYFSYGCLKQLVDQELLSLPVLRTSMLADDHLMGLLVKSAGLDIEEFEQGDDPLCLDWLNLPCAPDEIVERGKKITHSVKRWQDLEQSEIRGYFRDRRISD